jgi:hypothetical protein
MVLDNTLFVSWWHSIPSVMNNCTLACSHKVPSTISFFSNDTIKIELPLYTFVHCDLILMVHIGDPEIFHQFRGHLQILGTRRMTCIKMCTEDLQFLSDLWTSLYIMLSAKCMWTDTFFGIMLTIIGATVQHLITRHPGFEHLSFLQWYCSSVSVYRSFSPTAESSKYSCNC